MRSKLLRIVLWLIAFIVLLLYRTVYSFDGRTISNIVFTVLDIGWLFLCSRMIGHIIISRLLYKKKLVPAILSFFVLLVFSIWFIQILQGIWYKYVFPLKSESLATFDSWIYQVFNTWLVMFPGFICIVIYRLIQDHWTSVRRFELLQKEQAQTELNFLKAQINPHFLFNSINSVYGSIDKQNQLARNTLLTFSDMLRYQLYECNTDSIPIEREIHYIHNYIILQKLRHENSLDVNTSFGHDLGSITIAPLLLIPFLENAFKYVSRNYRQKNSIRISLRNHDQMLQFHIINTCDNKPVNEFMENRGIGISNVRRRLELLYPDRHQLHISKTEDTFEVLLSIKLG